MKETNEATQITLEGNPGVLERVFRLRHQAERVLDRMFADAAVGGAYQIVLYNEVDAGLGDVAFASKLLQLLTGALPNARLTLVSTGTEKQAIFGLPKGVVLRGVDGFKSDRRTAARGVDLVVSAPGIFDHCRHKPTVLQSLGLPADTPFLFIAEYGSLRQLQSDAFQAKLDAIQTRYDEFLDEVALRENVDADAMGYRRSNGDVVHVKEDKVVVLGHLSEAIAHPGPSNPLSQWLTQPCLDARSAGLDEGEMGIFIDDALHPKRGQSLDSGPPPAASLQHQPLRELLLERPDAALYVGYAHSGQSIFLDMIAVLEKPHFRPVDVVIPNARTAEDTRGQLFEESFLKRLQGAGFGSVEIIGNTSETQQTRTLAHEKTTLGKGKHLRLITCYPLPHADMRHLLRTSEAATMVSGDQSFSEAVSAGKHCLVIEPVYCQTYHLDAQLTLAERIAPELRQVLAFAMNFQREEKAWDEVEGILSGPGLDTAFDAYNALIHDEFRLNEPVVDLITRALLTAKHPHLAALQSQIFEEAFRGFSPATGWILPGNLLQLLQEELAKLIEVPKKPRPT